MVRSATARGTGARRADASPLIRGDSGSGGSTPTQRLFGITLHLTVRNGSLGRASVAMESCDQRVWGAVINPPRPKGVESHGTPA